MHKRMRFRGVLPMALVGFVLSSTAFAQNPDAKSELARKAYAKGESLYKAGHYEAAQVQFEAAYEASPNPVVLLGVAKTQEKRGNIQGAVATLERYLKERPDAPDRADIEKHLKKLRATPARYKVSSQPQGARILVDGQKQPHQTPAEIQLTPGEHVIELRHPGYENKKIEVAAGFADRKPLAVALRKQRTQDASAVGAQEPLEEPTDLMPLVWTGVAVSGAAVVAGTVLGILALKEQSDFNDNPTESSADRGENLALFADLSFGLALAAGITSLILYLDHQESQNEFDTKKARARFELKPAVSMKHASLHAQLHF